MEPHAHTTTTHIQYMCAPCAAATYERRSTDNQEGVTDKVKKAFHTATDSEAQEAHKDGMKGAAHEIKKGFKTDKPLSYAAEDAKDEFKRGHDDATTEGERAKVDKEIQRERAEADEAREEKMQHGTSLEAAEAYVEQGAVNVGRAVYDAGVAAKRGAEDLTTSAERDSADAQKAHERAN